MPSASLFIGAASLDGWPFAKKEIHFNYSPKLQIIHGLAHMNAEFPYRTRRTIKPHQMDRARDVPRDLLLEILEDAHWAPTHGLTQPWRFHVFTGPARERLADGLQSLYDRLTPAAEARPDKREKLRAPMRSPRRS